MKKTFILLAIVGILLGLVGCASSPQVKPHRPEYYQPSQNARNKTDEIVVSTAQVVGGAYIGAMFSGAAENYRLQQLALRVYPECHGLIENELWKCVREIDIKEGRITADYVGDQRVNLDDTVRPKGWGGSSTSGR